jgi:very-short-patch-repair endonuclease
MALDLMTMRTVQRARSLRKTMTPPELALLFQLRALRDAGWHFRRQSPEGPYVLDFVCRRAKLVIEVDGSQHGEARQAERDRVRDSYLQERGFRVLRFWAADVNEALDDVLKQVRAALGAENLPIVDASQPNQHEGARYRRLVRLGLRRRD